MTGGCSWYALISECLSIAREGCSTPRSPKSMVWSFRLASGSWSSSPNLSSSPIFGVRGWHPREHLYEAAIASWLDRQCLKNMGWILLLCFAISRHCLFINPETMNLMCVRYQGVLRSRDKFTPVCLSQPSSCGICSYMPQIADSLCNHEVKVYPMHVLLMSR